MKCIVTNWEYMDTLCRKVADQIREDDYNPECIVALAKGGWFAGNILCDMLGIDNLISVRARHYHGTKRVEHFPDINEKDFEYVNENVLIVDDVANTGKSLETAEKICKKYCIEVRTAVLQLMQNSQYTPHYFGDYIIEDAWIIFPWNFYEEMIALIKEIFDESSDSLSLWEIRWELYRKFRIDPSALEIAQPRKLEKVVEEMVERDILKEEERMGEVVWKKP